MITARRITSIAIGLTVALALAFAATVAARRQAAAAKPATLATLLPPGATMVLEAKDLSSLVRDWNASQAKTAWLQSANYETFVRSRLFLRLKDAYDEFATAAGVPPDMGLVSEVAGRESALGLYDIGKLEFLYVTRLPSAQAMENALWRGRGDYEPREVAGTPFYVRKDAESERVVAFAARDGYLLLATREDLLAGALTLIAGGSQETDSAATDSWYVQSVKAAGAAGDLRLVMDLETLVKEPHFRSYWIQENQSELKAYSSAVSDLVRTPSDLRETRVLVRATEQRPAPAGAAGAAAAAGPSGAATATAASATARAAAGTGTGAAAGSTFDDLLRAVPADAGLYRAWASPAAAEATHAAHDHTGQWHRSRRALRG